MIPEKVPAFCPTKMIGAVFSENSPAHTVSRTDKRPLPCNQALRDVTNTNPIASDLWESSLIEIFHVN
jgi:hypothetical protein